MINFDINRYFGMVLVNQRGVPLDFYVNWPYFEGQLIGKDNFQFFANFDRYFGEKKIGNFVNCTGALMCDNYALEKLMSYIEKDVEILPMCVESRELNVLNVIRIIDCLDKGGSDILYFSNSEDVMDIKKYAFFTEVIGKHCIFKIPQLVRTDIFATDTFRDKVLEHQLTGLKFDLVYSE